MLGAACPWYLLVHSAVCAVHVLSVTYRKAPCCAWKSAWTQDMVSFYDWVTCPLDCYKRKVAYQATSNHGMPMHLMSWAGALSSMGTVKQACAPAATVLHELDLLKAHCTTALERCTQ